MKYYEMLCVLPGTLAESDVQPVVTQVKDIVSQAGATDVSVTQKGKSRLAYPIKHIRYGYFQLFHFQAEPEALSHMRKKTELMDQVLRAIIRTSDESAPERHEQVVFGVHHRVDATPKAEREQKGEEKVRDRKAEVEQARMETFMSKKSDDVSVKKEERSAPETPKAAEEKVEDTEKKAVKLEDIDEKLDQILDTDLENL